MFKLNYSVFGSGHPGPAAKRAHTRRGGDGFLQKTNLRSVDFPRLVILAVAGAFFIVSASFSVRFAQSVGASSGNEWIFIMMALGVEGFAAFSLPAFWRSLGFAGRAVLVLCLTLCMAYKITAAEHFALENYGAREASQAGAADQYERAKQRVADLRGVLQDNAGARAAGVVEADIKATQQHARWSSTSGCTNATVDPSREFCAAYFALDGELAMALKAAAAERDLAVAIGKLEGMDPAAAAPRGEGAIIPQLLEWAGITVGGFTVFISKLCMLIVEGGSVAVPAMAGLARPKRDEPEAVSMPASPQSKAAAPDVASPPTSVPARPMTAKERAVIDELTAFLQARTERQAGEQVQSSRLYAAYVGWKEGQKGKPLSIQTFGTVVTHQLGLAKSKIDGRHYYHNLRVTTQKASANLQLATSGER